MSLSTLNIVAFKSSLLAITSTIPHSCKNSLFWKFSGSFCLIVCSITLGPANPILAFGSLIIISPNIANEAVTPPVVGLTGTEIKSIRRGRINLKDSYCQSRRGEMFVYNMHISHFEEGNRFNHEPLRVRKLLLKKKQIAVLTNAQNEVGISIIPLKMYIKNGYAKLLIGVAKGKKNYDKRHVLKQKEATKEIHRVLKDKQRY